MGTRLWSIGIVGLALTVGSAFGANHDLCTCRFKGQNLSLGSKVCLNTPTGPRVAECVIEINVTSWRIGQDGCVQAMLNRDHL